MAKARPVEGLRSDDEYAVAAAKVVAVRSREVADHSRDVLDVADIERVHDMRVASRRLRAVLEIFATCFPKAEYRSVLRDVKRLADALGERRDPDVQLAAIEHFARHVGDAERPGLELVSAAIGARQAAGNEQLAAALAQVATSDLRGRLLALADAAEERAQAA
jgi:CHAD domain-containing protein